jgi:hypothetical protein
VGRESGGRRGAGRRAQEGQEAGDGGPGSPGAWAAPRSEGRHRERGPGWWRTGRKSERDVGVPHQNGERGPGSGWVRIQAQGEARGMCGSYGEWGVGSRTPCALGDGQAGRVGVGPGMHLPRAPHPAPLPAAPQSAQCALPVSAACSSSSSRFLLRSRSPMAGPAGQRGSTPQPPGQRPPTAVRSTASSEGPSPPCLPPRPPGPPAPPRPASAGPVSIRAPPTRAGPNARPQILACHLLAARPRATCSTFSFHLCKKDEQARRWKFTPVVLAIKEARIRRIAVRGQPGQIVHGTLPPKLLA